MPSKIKSKLLIITVLCATLAILFIIAPLTAALYSGVLLGISLVMSVFAWGNAKKDVNLQYKVSSFMTLIVFILVAMAAALVNALAGGLHYILAVGCGLVALRSITLLLAEEK